MNESARSSGFTLIELLIVVAIIAVLSSAVLPAFSSYLSTQGLKQSQEQVKSDLRNVQNRALTGTGADRLIGTNPVRYWGVKFQSDGRTYKYFIADSNTVDDCNYSNDTNDPVEGSYELPEGYKFMHGGCVFFSLENGDFTGRSIGGTNRVIVGYENSTSGGTNCNSVQILTAGLINNSTTTCQ